MKHICPYCGERTFSPLQKALCGSIISKGRLCPKCGGRCVNGKSSLIAQYVISFTALIIVYTVYIKAANVWIAVGAVIGIFVLKFVFDMLFGKLIPAIKRI